MEKNNICDVCNQERAKNLVICNSEKCSLARLLAYHIDQKYFPTRGCDNCWGDLGRDCDETCRQEFRDSLKFGQDLWVLVHYLTDHPRDDELYKSTIALIKENQNFKKHQTVLPTVEK